jgi:hypothetical protein
MIGVAGLVLGIGLGAGVVSGALRVESRSPDALCPDAGQVSEGARRRIGEIEGSGDWLASYTLVHRPEAGEADVVRLELTDPAGRLRMERELPRAGESCTAVAQALVLLLDAYFRSPADEPVDDAPARPPAATVAMAPAPAPAAAPVRVPPRLTVGLLGGWQGGPSSAALGGGLGVGFRRRWVAGVEGTWTVQQQDQAVTSQGATGTVALRTATVRLYLARRFALGPRAALLAGPEALLALDRLVTEGLPEGTSNVRGAGGPGLRASLRVPLSDVVTIGLTAAADYAPRGWAGRLAFEDAPGELFPSPRLRLFSGVEVGFVLAP